jgi:hypothetical protein
MQYKDKTYVLDKISSFRFVISAKADVRASSFPAVADTTASEIKLDSFSSSETFSLSECTSASRAFFVLST